MNVEDRVIAYRLPRSAVGFTLKRTRAGRCVAHKCSRWQGLSLDVHYQEMEAHTHDGTKIQAPPMILGYDYIFNKIFRHLPATRDKSLAKVSFGERWALPTNHTNVYYMNRLGPERGSPAATWPLVVSENIGRSGSICTGSNPWGLVGDHTLFWATPFTRNHDTKQLPGSTIAKRIKTVTKKRLGFARGDFRGFIVANGPSADPDVPNIFGTPTALYLAVKDTTSKRGRWTNICCRGYFEERPDAKGRIHSFNHHESFRARWGVCPIIDGKAVTPEGTVPCTWRS